MAKVFELRKELQKKKIVLLDHNKHYETFKDTAFLKKPSFFFSDIFLKLNVLNRCKKMIYIFFKHFIFLYYQFIDKLLCIKK